MPDQLKLHLVVLAWGLTAVLGKLIGVPAAEVVMWRTFLATGGLVVVALAMGVTVRPGWREAAKLTGTGIVLGLHWVLFFTAAKVANVSICLVGAPTMLLWGTLLERLLLGGRRIKHYELVLGLIMILAVWIVYRGEISYSWGLTISLASAVVASLFGVINGELIKKHHPVTITVYEMGGACLVSGLGLWGMTAAGWEVYAWPGLRDWGLILILALVCTVAAYAVYVELLRRLSVFAINLANNMEPVYGILLATLVFGRAEKMTPGFYAGTGVILAAVLVHPMLVRRYESVGGASPSSPSSPSSSSRSSRPGGSAE